MVQLTRCARLLDIMLSTLVLATLAHAHSPEFSTLSRRQSGSAVCGYSDGKKVNVKKFVRKAVKDGLPTINPNGTVEMSLQQSSADSAGPYQCFVSQDATGKDLVQMEILVNVPSANEVEHGEGKEYPLLAQMPSGAQCSGPSGSCLIACKNELDFGSCAVIALDDQPTAAPSEPETTVSTKKPKKTATATIVSEQEHTTSPSPTPAPTTAVESLLGFTGQSTALAVNPATGNNGPGGQADQARLSESSDAVKMSVSMAVILLMGIVGSHVALLA